VRALRRSNPRAAVVELAVLTALPVLAVRGWARRSAGARLSCLPGGEG